MKYPSVPCRLLVSLASFSSRKACGSSETMESGAGSRKWRYCPLLLFLLLLPCKQSSITERPHTPPSLHSSLSVSPSSISNGVVLSLPCLCVCLNAPRPTSIYVCVLVCVLLKMAGLLQVGDNPLPWWRFHSWAAGGMWLPLYLLQLQHHQVQRPKWVRSVGRLLL